MNFKDKREGKEKELWGEFNIGRTSLRIKILGSGCHLDGTVNEF